MSDVKLSAPMLRVILGDGSTQEVQCTNADMVRFDMTRARQKWPTATDAPFLWMTFVSWAALRRTHGIPDTMTYESFADSTVDISNLDSDDGDGGSDVDPTRTGVEPV